MTFTTNYEVQTGSKFTYQHHFTHWTIEVESVDENGQVSYTDKANGTPGAATQTDSRLGFERSLKNFGAVQFQ